MASYHQTKAGTWGVRVSVGDQRDSATFGTKREAQAWAARRTTEMRATKGGTLGQVKTLADALRKYRTEVAPTKRGQRWELVRLNRFLTDPNLPLTLPLDAVTPQHLARWRDVRQIEVSAGSVLRELGLLGSVLTAARRDWHWISHSPMSDVRRPAAPANRERLITWREVKGVLRALTYRPHAALTERRHVTGLAFLLALRTGMRAGELVGMRWPDVHGAWVTLPMTKNGFARDVPLPPKARRLMARAQGLDDDRVLPVSAGVLDALFRRARVTAGLAGFTFHDARHVAATRIGRQVGQPGRLSFVEFCRAFGWRDPKRALVYVNTSAADLASRMA